MNNNGTLAKFVINHLIALEFGFSKPKRKLIYDAHMAIKNSGNGGSRRIKEQRGLCQREPPPLSFSLFRPRALLLLATRVAARANGQTEK